jgi:hypothetical protein
MLLESEKREIADCLETNFTGSLELNKGHICFERGHNMFLVVEIDNGRSKYGEHKCSRCGFVDSFQYDYSSW